jgi:hypothetical protein
VRTEFTACGCGVRVILAKGVPALNYGPDPAGTVAAEHKASGAWRARFLGRGEDPVLPEKRYSVHECDTTRRAAQRAHLRKAEARHSAAQRSKRGRPRPAPIQPGMFKINPGR